MKKSKIIIVIGIIILSVLVYKIGIANILETLKGFNFLLLLPILLTFIITYLLAGINIWILIRPFKKIPLSTTIKYIFFTLFYSSFMPGKLADFLIIFYLKRNKINVSKSTIITLFDKSISLVIKSILGIVGAILILKELKILTLGIPILMISGIAISFLLISSKKFREAIIRIFLKKYARIFKGFSKDLKLYLRKHKSNLIYNFLITLIKILFETTLLFLLFTSFGEHTNFISVLLIFSLLSILNFFLLPIGVSGLGMREALGVIMYSSINLDPAVVLSSYILRLILVYITNLITLILHSKELNLIKKQKFFEKVRFK